MAAKKKSKKKTTNKKSKSKALVSMSDFENQMAAQAEEDSARVTSGGGGSTSLSIRGGTFTLGDADLGDEITVVVINFANEKAWYEEVYDPDNPAPPDCFAVGTELPDELVVSSVVEDPICDNCEECEYNQWGSADRGKGKACKDKRRLMVVALEDLEEIEDLEDIEISMLKAPPTSVGNWDKYVKGLAKVHKRPCYGVSTTINFDEDADYPILNFTTDEPIQDAGIMQRIMELRELCEEDMVRDYSPAEEEEEEEAPRRKAKKKTSKKKTSKKKASKKKGRRR